jgi:hypothetical protein
VPTETCRDAAHRTPAADKIPNAVAHALTLSPVRARTVLVRQANCVSSFAPLGVTLSASVSTGIPQTGTEIGANDCTLATDAGGCKGEAARSTFMARRCVALRSGQMPRGCRTLREKRPVPGARHLPTGLARSSTIAARMRWNRLRSAFNSTIWKVMASAAEVIQCLA